MLDQKCVWFSFPQIAVEYGRLISKVKGQPFCFNNSFSWILTPVGWNHFINMKKINRHLQTNTHTLAPYQCTPGNLLPLRSRRPLITVIFTVGELNLLPGSFRKYIEALKREMRWLASFSFSCACGSLEGQLLSLFRILWCLAPILRWWTPLVFGKLEIKRTREKMENLIPSVFLLVTLRSLGQ